MNLLYADRFLSLYADLTLAGRSVSFGTLRGTAVAPDPTTLVEWMMSQVALDPRERKYRDRGFVTSTIVLDDFTDEQSIRYGLEHTRSTQDRWVWSGGYGNNWNATDDRSPMCWRILRPQGFGEIGARMLRQWVANGWMLKLGLEEDRIDLEQVLNMTCDNPRARWFRVISSS